MQEMKLRLGYIVEVKDLRVQTSLGAYEYTGHVIITDFKPKGTVSPLKIKTREGHAPPLISPEDYFTFNILGSQQSGTSSRSELEGARIKTMSNAIFYFGTALERSGHFFWELEAEYMSDIGLSFPLPNGKSRDHKTWPFDPEKLPITKGQFYIPLGEANYYRIGLYTICNIIGSCADRRPGSISCFFTQEQLKFSDLAIKIMSIPSSRAIIKKMPFSVNWKLTEDILIKIK